MVKAPLLRPPPVASWLL